MIWLEAVLWQQNVLLGMCLQNQITALNAASDFQCNRLSDEQLRFLCPCGTSFSTYEIEPNCPTCGGILVIRYKRKPTPPHSKHREVERE